METVTRYVGYCQICEGQFKLDTAKNMVHHGYKRPGHGYIVGDCMAVGCPAYEQSCEVLKQYTQSLRDTLAAGREHLRKLETGEITAILAPSHETRYSRNPQLITYKPGDLWWSDVLNNAISDVQRKNNWFAQDIERCERRIAAWKPLPLRTVEEEQAAVRSSKDEARAKREAKKAAKLAEKVASYQKRIDSALRNHTTSTLGDIFESCQIKLREIAGYDVLTREQALALVDRNHVWLAFGLDLQDLKSRANQDLCSTLRYPQYQYPKGYPWPEGLTAKRD